MKMKSTQVNLPLDLYEQAQELAQQRNRSYSNFMLWLLEKHIENSEVPEINRVLTDAHIEDMKHQTVE